MPRKTGRANEPAQPAAKETPPPPTAKASRRGTRKTSPREPARESAGTLIDQEPANQAALTTSPISSEHTQEEATPAATRQADLPPTGSGPTQAAPSSLAGLRGSDYVKALAASPHFTLQVPILPAERRGDWERAKGQKIPVTTRQMNHQPDTTSQAWLEREHALAALIIELQRPGATRYDQIDLNGSPARTAIERLSDYMNQARLRTQAQTGKKWSATHIYLIPIEDT